MKYNEYRSVAKTGDLVLFSGKGTISDLIKHISGSDWSHIGVVIADRHNDWVLLWESTTLSNIADLDTGLFVEGVQLVPLSQRIELYDGRVGIRRLHFDLTVHQLQVLADLRRERQGVPYESNLLELVRSAYDGPLGDNRADMSTIFCSELVADVYQHWGFLPTDPPANEYIPGDFVFNFGTLLTELEILEK